MGRPPIGKRAMTSTERSRRYRAGLATKPTATKPSADANAELKRRIRELEARIRELESEDAGAEKPVPIPSRVHVKPSGPQELRGNVGKMIRMLGSPEDGVVLAAARALARTKDLHALAQVAEAWEKQQIGQQPVKKPVQINWPIVEEFVGRFTAGKKQLRFGQVLVAVHAEIPATREHQEGTWVYIQGCLQRLGFKPSSSGLTWTLAGSR
jgi:hypothetical protein